MDHEHIVRSLEQSVYNRNLINNAERGTYVEHMIFLALKGKGWDLTWPWASWDLEHLRWPKEKRPRIEVKQSAARAPDHAEKRPNPPPETPARFSIKLRKYYYLRDGTLVKTPLRRHADLYVFAWHPEADLNIADHRCPDQWKFFVVAELELPTPPDPPPKNMSISPPGLKKLSGAKQGRYEELPAMVTKVLESIPEGSWKAVEDAEARARK